MRFERGGRLSNKVEIHLRSTDVSAYGEHSEAFTLTATRWASVEPVSAREYSDSIGENIETNTRFRFRYDSVIAALTSADRLKFGGNIYDIKSIINVNSRNKDILITAVLNERQR